MEDWGIEGILGWSGWDLNWLIICGIENIVENSKYIN